MKNMKLKSQKLIKHSTIKKEINNNDTPIVINKKEKTSSVDNRNNIKDVKKILKSPGFNIYLTKFDEIGDKTIDINFYNTNANNPYKKTIDSDTHINQNNCNNLATEKEIVILKKNEINTQENKINIKFNINSEIYNNNINIDKKNLFKEKTNDIRKSIYQSTDNTNQSVIKLKEAIKEKDRTIEKLQKELENAKMAIFKLKNNSAINNIKLMKVKGDEHSTQPFSDRKRNVKIDLASEYEEEFKLTKRQLDLNSPKISFENNFGSLKRYDSVKNESRQNIKENFAANKTRNSSNFPRANNLPNKLIDSYASNLRISYASPLSPKLKIEEISDISEGPLKYKKVNEEEMTNSNIFLNNIELSESLKSLKCRAHKVLELYSNTLSQIK